MKNKRKPERLLPFVTAGRLAALLLAVFIASAAAGEQPPSEKPDKPETVNAAVIPCHDVIDDGLYHSIVRRSEEAIINGAEYLIFEISTYGGMVESADNISKYMILELGPRVHTIAYVSTEAISAGAMISTSCKDIIMRVNTTIGASAPIIMGGELEGAEREKIESFIRATFSRAAEANDYPEALLKAMVSQKIEVWQVYNKQEKENEYFEKEFLPTDPNTYDLKNKKLIVKEGELLTLTALKAEEYGIARAVVEDLEEAITFMEKRDGVDFETPIPRLETNWSEEMVRFINSPAVASILILGILLGIYVELNTPGLGLPSLLAVTCLVILVGSKYLYGMANWVEVAVLVVGIILMMIEIFVLPGFGVAGIAGIILIIAGLFGMLIRNAPDELPWPTTQVAWDLFAQGLLGLVGGLVGFLIFAAILARYMPKLMFLSGLVLRPAFEAGGTEHKPSITAPQQYREEGLNIGQVGVVNAPLRPTGSARFGEKLVDVVAVGDFILKGEQVEILEIHGNRVVVRKSGNQKGGQ